MNVLDILLLIPLIYAAWKGFKHGLIIEIFTLLAFLVGIYIGIHFSDSTGLFLRNQFGLNSSYLPTIAFTVTFLVVGASVYFLGKAIEKLIKVAQLSPFNRIAGSGFSLLKYVFILSAFLGLLESYDEKLGLLPSKLKQQSLLYRPMQHVSLASIPGFKNSTIFVSNLLDSDSSTYGLPQIRRAKFLADSLDIETSDSVTLRKIYFTYETPLKN